MNKIVPLLHFAAPPAPPHPRLVASVPVGVWCALAALCGVTLPLLAQLAGSTLAMLAIPCLILAVGALVADPRHVLYLIILLRAALDGPFEALKSSMGGEAMGLGAALNGAVIVIAAKLVMQAPRLFPQRLAGAWLALLLAALCGVLQSSHSADAVRLCLTWATNFAILTAAFYIARTPDQMRGCLRLIVYSSLIPAAYGCYELVFGGAAAERVKSTFNHANVFAFYLVLVIGVAAFLMATRGRTAAHRVAWVKLYLVLLACLLVSTQTRSAWLVGILMFAGYGALFARRYLAYLALGLLILLCIPAVRDRLLDLSDVARLGAAVQRNSLAWRVDLWQSALAAMEAKHYPLGYGLGAFRDDSVLFFSKSAGVPWDAHNVYVQLLFDLGIFGLLAYLATQAALLRQGAAIWTKDPLAGYFVCAMVALYALCAFSDNMLFYLSVNWYYWLALGALLSAMGPPQRAASAGHHSSNTSGTA